MRAVSRAQARARRVGSIAADSNRFGFGLTGAAAARVSTLALAEALLPTGAVSCPPNQGLDGPGPLCDVRLPSCCITTCFQSRSCLPPHRQGEQLRTLTPRQLPCRRSRGR
jgi:hypothetical protein